VGDGTSRGSKRRGFFKWKVGAGRRGTIRRAALRSGNGFEVMGACIALLDHARDQSHYRDNPEGAFRTTLEDLSIDYSTPVERVRETLGALEATGWLKVSPDVDEVSDEDDITVRVVRFLTYNDPQGSAADRKAAERDRKAAEVRECADLRGSVTTRHASRAKSLEREGEERESQGSNEPLSATAARKADVAQDLFDLWIAETGRNPNQNRLTKSRRRMVNGRVNDGYTVEQLQQAIRGIAASPYHRGENPQGTRYDTFDFIMRSGENVEKGIERAAAPIDDVAAMYAALSKRHSPPTATRPPTPLSVAPASPRGAA
jgi:hypothetical protein